MPNVIMRSSYGPEISKNDGLLFGVPTIRTMVSWVHIGASYSYSSLEINVHR